MYIYSQPIAGLIQRYFVATTKLINKEVFPLSLDWSWDCILLSETAHYTPRYLWLLAQLRGACAELTYSYDTARLHTYMASSFITYAYSAWKLIVTACLQLLILVSKVFYMELFLIYINDQPECVSSMCSLFANDCLVYRKIAYCLKIELCLLTSRLCLLYKILHNIVDVTLPSCITPLTRLTRGHDQKFILPQSRIDAYKFNFFPNSIRLWNNLPIETVHVHTIDRFCNLLYSS